jgi:hypothetical protein
VTWPKTRTDGDDIGCGPGIAKVDATLSVGFLGKQGTGTIEGCLDDTPLPGEVPKDEVVFPPKLWDGITLDVGG